MINSFALDRMMVPENAEIKLTIVSAYYENPHMAQFLADWYNRFSPETKSMIEIILVDDGSRQHPLSENAVRLNLPHQLFRVHQDIRWNQDGARNIGCHHARADWIILTDIDHLFEESDILRAIETPKADKPYLLLRKHFDGGEYIHPHTNTLLLTRQRYWKIGGYDEAYRGHYGTDKFFLCRAFHGNKKSIFPVCSIVVTDNSIADANTRNYSRKIGWQTKLHRKSVSCRKRLNILPEVSLFREKYSLIGGR
ncbi:glycosyltransferase [Primorskyibacter marinus]|uniref:glycosyltransferase n=1 Tax=Primorskyibacter marinus TaxID=1977320 RepID=UPI000E30992A|nr:glycosyltransferase [Primorskyibacter marinus]